MGNIYQKLLLIQKHILGLSKDKKTYSYSYVTGDKVLGLIKPLMNEHGLLLKQEILSIDNTREDYFTGKEPDRKEKSEINSKVMMRFTWIDCETGEKDENLFGANGQNDWDKGVGSALTYAERYFLLKYFHIATDEDDVDNPDRKQEQPEAKKPETAKPTPIQPNKNFDTDNRPFLTEKMFGQLLEKIKGGDSGVLKKTTAAFQIAPEYLQLLTTANNQIAA